MEREHQRDVTVACRAFNLKNKINQSRATWGIDQLVWQAGQWVEVDERGFLVVKGQQPNWRKWSFIWIFIGPSEAHLSGCQLLISWFSWFLRSNLWKRHLFYFVLLLFLNDCWYQTKEQKLFWSLCTHDYNCHFLKPFKCWFREKKAAV